MDYARQIRNASLLINEGVRALPTANAAPSEYSITRAIRDLVDNNGKVGSLSTPESRASRIEADRLGLPPNPGCLYVPVQSRDATVAGTGGYLVGTANAPGEFFQSAYRANSVSAALGVPTFDVPSMNVTLPTIAGDITTYWLSDEGTQLTEGHLTFGQVASSPKTVGCFFEISDRLLKQMTPAGERFIMAEAGKAVAAAVDAALINRLLKLGRKMRPLALANATESRLSVLRRFRRDIRCIELAFAFRFSVHRAAPHGTAIGIRAMRIRLLAVMVSLNC